MLLVFFCFLRLKAFLTDILLPHLSHIWTFSFSLLGGGEMHRAETAIIQETCSAFSSAVQTHFILISLYSLGLLPMALPPPASVTDLSSTQCFLCAGRCLRTVLRVVPSKLAQLASGWVSLSPSDMEVAAFGFILLFSFYLWGDLGENPPHPRHSLSRTQS